VTVSVSVEEIGTTRVERPQWYADAVAATANGNGTADDRTTATG
jgi:hypothetical protein